MIYGVPAILMAECRSRLPEDMLYILGRFDIAREHGHDVISDDTPGTPNRAGCTEFLGSQLFTGNLQNALDK